MYAHALATVRHWMLLLVLVCSLPFCLRSFIYGDDPLAQVPQVSTCSRHRCSELLRGPLLSQDSLDSPVSTRALYRSALKAWLEYCDLLRRIDPAATNAPWPVTKVSCCWLKSWQQALNHAECCSPLWGCTAGGRLHELPESCSSCAARAQRTWHRC